MQKIPFCAAGASPLRITQHDPYRLHQGPQSDAAEWQIAPAASRHSHPPSSEAAENPFARVLSELHVIGGRLGTLEHEFRKMMGKLEHMDARMQGLEDSLATLRPAVTMAHGRAQPPPPPPPLPTATLPPYNSSSRVLHPCIRVYGNCNYGSKCLFASYPRDACLRYLKGRSCASNDCPESHPPLPPDRLA